MNELRNLLLIIRSIKNIDGSAIVDVLNNSPDWLAKKLRLYPSKNLDSKLSCLEYQLDEYVSGKAVDIEDHFLNFGVGKADLTYKKGNNYHFVDVTTSSDRSKLTNKEMGIRSQSLKVANSTVEVRTIPMNKTMEHVKFFWNRSHEDVIDKVLRSAILSDKVTKMRIEHAVLTKLYPKYLLTLLSPHSKPVENKGSLSYSLVEHDNDLSKVDSRILREIEEMITMIKGYDKRSPLRVPIPKAMFDIECVAPDIDDPVNICLYNIMLNNSIITTNNIYEIDIRDIKSISKTTPITDKEMNYLLKYKENGITNLQRMASDLPEGKIIYIIGPEKSTTPKGIEYPKYFTVGTSIITDNFASVHLDRQMGVDKKSKYNKLNMNDIQDAINVHNATVEEMTKEVHVSTFVKKMAALSNTSGTKEWFKLWTGSFRDAPLKSMAVLTASTLYSYSRTISLALSEKPLGHRFRIMITPDEDCVLSVSIGKQLSKVTDVCVSFLCNNFIMKSNSRSRNRTISVSQRELTWWIKLMPTIIAKYSVDAQHNLTLGRNDTIHNVKSKDISEFFLMHLGTRQTDSIIQGQLRYTMAGLYSPITSRLGAIEKLKDLNIKGPHMLVYFFRLAKIQSISYLTKTGMSPKIEIPEDSPIALSPPFQSTPVTSYPQYIDAIFDSSMFNKIKDRKVDSQAIDWLNLVKTDIEFSNVSATRPDLVRGYTDNAKRFIESPDFCIDKLVSDLEKDDSIVLREAIEMDRIISTSSEKFKWNLLGMFIIAIKQTRGRTLVEEVESVNNPLSYLMSESLSTIMSSTGSVEKGKITKDRQSVRKSTALSWELIATYNSDIKMKNVGKELYEFSDKLPSIHQSILSTSMNILNHNGSSPIVSRTETKDQKDSYREFSPMNAIGVISCRAAERLVLQILPMYSTDRMADNDPEHTLYTAVKNTENTSRNLYISADCSRFGPNQIMSKSRIVAFALSFSSNSNDDYSTITTYELLAESTRLMENKLAKVPHELYEFIIKSGGLQTIKQHNPDSVYGQLATSIMEYYRTTKMPNYMLQKFGMYQGALGMFSSIASTMLHDTLLDLTTEMSFSTGHRALVTNDDSLLIFPEVTRNLTEMSSVFMNTLYKILYIGGQILNKFKTVPTTKLAEFHSTFALPRGLICPELKQLFAGIQVSSGESLYKDSRQPIEQAIACVRQGVSLFSATSLAIILNCIYCDQYNRWPSYKVNGYRLSQLGGPCEANILGEMFIPNFSDLKKMNEMGIPTDVQSKFLSNSLISDELSDIVEATNIKVQMITRSTYRAMRGLGETQWVQEVQYFPLSESCTVGHLVSSMSYGLFKGDREKNLSDTLVRYARNQVSREEPNIWVSDNSLIKHIIGKDKISYNELDSINSADIIKAVSSISTEHHDNIYYNSILIGYRNIVDAGSQLSGDLPTLGRLIQTSKNTVSADVVHPTRVVSNLSGDRIITPTMVAMNSSDTALINAITDEVRQIFIPNRFNELRDNFNTAMSLATVSNKLNHFRTGPMKLIEPSPKYSKIEQAIIKIAQNTIRGLSNTSPFALALASVARTTFIPDAPPDNALTEIESFIIMMRSRSLRNGILLKIPPIGMADTFKGALNSWWVISNKRWKVSRIRRKRSPFSFGKIEQGIVVTSLVRVGGNNLYEHTIFCNVNSIKLSEWDSFLNTYIDNNSTLYAGQTYIFTNDVVKIISHNTPIIGKTLVTNSGLLYFEYSDVKIPLVYDRQHAKLTKTVSQVPTDQQADKADLEVYASFANKMYNDAYVSDLKGLQFDESYANIVYSRYGGKNLKHDLESEMMMPEMPDVCTSEFLLARSRLWNWLIETDSGYFESDVYDDYNTEKFEFDEHLEANIGIDSSDEDFLEGDIGADVQDDFYNFVDYFNNGFEPADFA